MKLLAKVHQKLNLEEMLTFKKKVAVFISGRGSNLKNLYKFSTTLESKFVISLVISNKKEAKGILFSKTKKIKTIYIDKKMSIFEKKALIEISKHKIDILCLAGFMRILSKEFIENTNIPVLNIHPSLLPKFKGLNTHERAINKKEKFSGCTVHFVTAKLDSGKIILQKKVKIAKSETPKSLASKVLKAEHQTYPLALNKIC